MRRRISTRLGLALAVSACLAALPSSWGSSVNVTLNNGGGPLAPLAARGTVTVDAYSQQGAAKNTTTTSNVTVGGATVNPTPGAAGRLALNGTTYAIGRSPSINASYVTGRNLVLKNLGPTVNLSTFNAGTNRNNSLLNKASLTNAGDQYTINSNTGSYTGMGQAIIAADGTRSIGATATVAGAMPPVGEAAGRALDPFSFTSTAELNYTPTLGFDIHLAPGESGGIEAFATDSNEFSNLNGTTDEGMNTDGSGQDGDAFDAAGDPLNQTLWSLSAGDDDSNGTDAFAIDFELNPNALGTELDFSHTIYAGDSVSQIDSAIDGVLASHETISGDEVVFNAIDIMPANTMIEGSNGEAYADEVDADIVATPLPGAAVSGMLLLGLIAAGKLLRSQTNLKPSFGRSYPTHPWA